MPISALGLSCRLRGYADAVLNVRAGTSDRRWEVGMIAGLEAVEEGEQVVSGAVAARVGVWGGGPGEGAFL
jgi:hypothetical protein